MKFSFPHIRNDHLEAHQKIWRKHRRVALHSNPEESSPIMHPELAPCSDKLLVIETPQSLSCSTADTLCSSGSTTACHTSSCSPCDICVRAEPLQGFITLVTSLWRGNSSAPTSPCRAAPSPRGVLLQHHLGLRYFVYSPPSIHQRGDSVLVTTDKTLKQTSKKPSSPQSTQSSSPQWQNWPQCALGYCFHQKKGTVQRYFIKVRATNLSPGHYSNYQRAQLQNMWIAFGMKYLILLKTAEQVPHLVLHFINRARCHKASPK